MLDLWVSLWHDIHELTEVVDDTVLSCIVRANDGLDKMRPHMVGLPAVSSRLPLLLGLGRESVHGPCELILLSW